MLHSLQGIVDHPCYELYNILEVIFREAANGSPFSRGLFPERIRTRWTRIGNLPQDMEDIYIEIVALPVADRENIYQQFLNNNLIQDLCEDATTPFIDNIEWEEPFGNHLAMFVKGCYKKLDLSIFRRIGCSKKPTKRFYEDFIQINKLVCPFCGMQTYKNPRNVRREDFDHYLNKVRYPLAAANMMNLVPMCTECNQGYKKEKNVIFDGANRILAYYPYSGVAGVEIVTHCTTYPTLDDVGEWSVQLIPNDVAETAKINNWDRIFRVSERMANEIIEYYQEWMDDSLERNRPNDFEDLDQFREFFRQQALDAATSADRKMEPRAHLKKAFFSFIADEAEEVFAESFLVSYRAQLALAA